MARQQPSEIGQRRAGARAVKHAHAERFLQRGDAVGQGRLRNTQRGSRVGVGAVPRDGEQVEQPLGIGRSGRSHNSTLSKRAIFVLDIMAARRSNFAPEKHATKGEETWRAGTCIWWAACRW